MILVHAIWHNAALHLWGECASKDKDSITPEAASSTSPQALDTLLISSPQDLRTLIGDHWDSLLVSEARPATLTLNLPHRAGRPLR